MARKRKRRMGHITVIEKIKIVQSINEAHESCLRNYPAGDNRVACVKGVRLTEGELFERLGR